MELSELEENEIRASIADLSRRQKQKALPNVVDTVEDHHLYTSFGIDNDYAFEGDEEEDTDDELFYEDTTDEMIYQSHEDLKEFTEDSVKEECSAAPTPSLLVGNFVPKVSTICKPCSHCGNTQRNAAMSCQKSDRELAQRALNINVDFKVIILFLLYV